jgi:MFS family permease
MRLHTVRVCYNLIVFLFWLATGLPMALTALLLQARGLSLFDLGLCLATHSLAVAALELPTGALADTWGRRTVNLLACGCRIAGLLIFLFAFSLPWFLLGGAVLGLGRALASGSLEAWFVDASRAADPNADLQEGFAQSGIAQVAGMGLGLLIGGFLPRVFAGLPPERTSVLSPLSTVLLAAVAVWLLAAVLIAALVREPGGREGGSRRPNLRGMSEVLRASLRLALTDRQVLLLLLPVAFWGLAFGSIEAFWQPFFAGLLGGFSGRTPWFGLVFAASFLCAGLGSALATRVSRALSRRHALACALASAVQWAALVLLAVQTRFLPGALCLWLVYAGNGLYQSPQAALFNDRIPAGQRATLLSIASLFMSLGGAAGDLGVGYLAHTFSIRVAWIAAAVPLMATIGIYLALWRSQEREDRALAAVSPLANCDGVAGGR